MACPLLWSLTELIPAGHTEMFTPDGAILPGLPSDLSAYGLTFFCVVRNFGLVTLKLPYVLRLLGKCSLYLFFYKTPRSQLGYSFPVTLFKRLFVYNLAPSTPQSLEWVTHSLFYELNVNLFFLTLPQKPFLSPCPCLPLSKIQHLLIFLVIPR